MSNKALNWAYDLPLTGSKKAVLIALADMADENHSCFPGQDRIAGMAGWSVETVRRALKGLELLGLITRTHRVGNFGYRTSDRYVLSVGKTLAESLPVNLPTRQSAYKATSRFLPVNESVPTGQSVGAIEPKEEPPVEPSDTSESDFEQWWKVYPRREAKKTARTAYELTRGHVDVATLLDAARAYASHNAGTDRRFLKLPAGWLLERRWEDEIVSVVTGTTLPTVPLECDAHVGYPLPCYRCELDATEGRAF